MIECDKVRVKRSNVTDLNGDIALVVMESQRGLSTEPKLKDYGH